MVTLKLFPVLLLISTSKATKSWINHPVDFFDSSNWEGGQKPCPLDKILFPENYPGIAFFPDELKIDEIILPRDGAVLPQPGRTTITFTSGKSTGNKNEKCEPNKSNLAKVKTMSSSFNRSWFQVENWKSEDSVKYGLEADNPAIPHINRIPCSAEKVIIRSKGMVSIDLDEINSLNVGSLEIGDENILGMTRFHYFLHTELGEIMFKNSDHTRIRFSPKETICGCHKARNIPAIKRRVCKYIKENSCPKPKCINPIIPEGHCCSMCGSMAKIHILDCQEFTLKLLRNRVEKILKDHKYADLIHFDVEIFEVDTNEKYIQLILIDKNDYDENSSKFMKILNKTNLFTDVAYRNLKKEFFTSGFAIDPENGTSIWTIIILTLIGNIIFFSIIYAHYVPENPYISLPPWLYPNRYNIFNSPFFFARFEDATHTGEVVMNENANEAHEEVINNNNHQNVPDDGNIVMNVTYDNEEDIAENRESGTTSFHNPMFQESTPRGKNNLPTTGQDNESSNSNNNPNNSNTAEIGESDSTQNYACELTEIDLLDPTSSGKNGNI